MHIKGLILYCHSHIQQSRSIYSIYHLMKGKKGIQSLHDARLFHLENMFGIYPTLQKQAFDRFLELLIKQKLLVRKDANNNEYVMTQKGSNWLNSSMTDLYINSYNGMRYTNVDNIFFYRLLLLIQTYTNLKKQNTSFIPITSDPDITEWVKKSYENMRYISVDKILYNFYREIKMVLKLLSNREAELIIDHFSGYAFYGMNSNQLAEKYNMNASDIYLVRTAIIHQILYEIERNKNDYQLLPKLISHNRKQQFILNTTISTYNLLNKGLTPERVAEVRNLKLNTIHDHIVEIALFEDEFPINEYVTYEEKRQIIKAVLQTKSYKLKDIKKKLADEISYFKIRLVLTERETFL